MNGKLYYMDFFSNLHVGGTGNAFSIVDLQVQRDPITDRPAIFASSLKGALRSHSTGLTDFPVDLIFGQDIDKDGKTRQGNVGFTDAHLLFYPLRTNQCAYMLATSPAMLQDFVEQLTLLDLAESALSTTCKAIIAAANKEWSAISSVNKPILLFGEKVNGTLRAESKFAQHVKAAAITVTDLPTHPAQLLLVADADMKVMMEDLPVLAHNRLKNGVSKNLWYEEVVPRKSVFYTMTFADCEDNIATLDQMLTSSFIQIGANATLGYGLCKFTAYESEA